MPPSPSNRSRSDAQAVAVPADDSVSAAHRSSWSILRDYLELTKPEISFLVTVSALAGFLMGSPGALDVWTLVWTLIGVGLCAGGVGVLNHVKERAYDAQMKRTRDRPLPAGRLSPKTARYVGFGMACAGIGIICPLVNPLTAVLAGATVVLYLYVYTPLKRETKWNTLIGTIPGALPALGGYTAATGDVGAAGWAIFAILALWQMPHFLSLAWMYRKDYARGDYAMLPVVEPSGDSTAWQTVGFTAALLIASLVPTWIGVTGWLYALGVAPLGLWFLWTAVVFAQERTGQTARRVLKASIVYVPVFVAVLFADWMV
jgi:protoheme IX farnesyltransferase